MATEKAAAAPQNENTPSAFTKRDHASDEPGEDTLFVRVIAGHFLIVLVLIGLLLKAPDTNADSATTIAANQVGRYYMFYSHVCIMIIVGFGYLMTFLKRHNYSSVSYNFMLAAFVFLWNMFAATFWERAHDGDMHRVAISMPLMVEGLFGAGCVLISFGAVLGKTTPSQLIVIAFWEVIFYSLNFMIGALELQASDAGGTIFVHTFGAYFGVALAAVMSPKGSGKAEHPYNGASYTSDMFSMIGTTFLWIFWPSFNAALASDGLQLQAIINTHLSLAGSVVSTFIASYILVHARIGWDSVRKFDMVHIQNATLAGGVAMGSAANMRMDPWVAILIGFAAGLLSTFGYHQITSYLASKFNIDDTCGVHNLHGMPGVFGVIVSVFVILGMDSDYTDGIVASGRSKGEQAGIQILALLITLAIAIVSGALTGKIAMMLPSIKFPLGAFSDHTLFEVPDDYISAGQAARGERGVTPAQAARAHCADLLGNSAPADASPVSPPPPPPAPAATATAFGGASPAGIALEELPTVAEAESKVDGTAAAPAAAAATKSSHD